MFKLLNGKKGFLAIALMMAGIIGLAFESQYYTWTASYSINPLATSIVDITIPDTSGATSGTYVPTSPIATISVPSRKTVNVHFMVTSFNASALADDYYSLDVTFTLGTVGSQTMHIVVNGAPGTTLDVSINGVGGGSYDLYVTVDYWTGAVTDTVGGSFTVNTYAVE
ncbi:MAG: hypothetical protein B9J98_00640 [Candidatus Terraquivivens tikiterensis]|uniref:Uncharacterized protein n=1 Tax=Candidatus Terraquivivens tikiterensis TaxID=1980982 RepID=A0A2R7YA20_9ARCH|nr:MAG: hypothetical protein B9J98_00640 [Candidatus Terraquivivens tikiterensis]